MAEDHTAQGPVIGLTPHLTIPGRGGEAAIEFYARAFGAVEASRTVAGDGERLLHACLLINGAPLMLSDDFQEHIGEPEITPRGVTLHLQVDDADEWWTRALVAGAVPLVPLGDQSWGNRYGQLRDPFGHTWSLGSVIAPRAQADASDRS